MNERMSQGRDEHRGLISINSPIAQIELAKKAFPDLKSNELMQHWIMEKQPNGFSLAEHFRVFVEDPEHATDSINMKDPEDLERLLERIKKYSPTVH